MSEAFPEEALDLRTLDLADGLRALDLGEARSTHAVYASALHLAWRLRGFPMAERVLLYEGVSGLLRVNALGYAEDALGQVRRAVTSSERVLYSSMNEARSLKGPTFAFGAALLFGASTPFAKALLGVVDPWLMAGLLYAGAGIGLVGFRLINGGGRLRLDIAKSDRPWLLGAIVFGGGVGPVLLMLGPAITDAATSSLLLTLDGVFTALIAWIAFREHVHARLIWGMGAIALGAATLAWNGAPILSAGLGPLLIAGACLAWGIDNNLTRKVALNDATVIAMLKGLFAGAANLALAALAGAHWPQFAPVIGSMVVGFAGYGVSLVLFVLALRELGTGRTGAYFSTAPFMGALLAVVMFHAPLTPILFGAGALMAVGVWLHLTETHAHEHQHEPLSHAHAHVHDDHHQHEHGPSDPAGQPHSHWHAHAAQRHAHAHYPDAHHRHGHEEEGKRAI